jgi:hypothetical protein
VVAVTEPAEAAPESGEPVNKPVEIVGATEDAAPVPRKRGWWSR